MLVAIILALVWALACLYFDAANTAKGIKAGVAVEGSGIIKFFARTDKPKLWELLLIDGTIRLMLFAPGVIFGGPFAALSFGTLLSAGLLNIRGGREWQWMFNHPGQKLPEMVTVWKKFIGFWG